ALALRFETRVRQTQKNKKGGTSVGHLEFSFAHLMRRSVKVIQLGLVCVIGWRTGPNAPGAASVSSSTMMQVQMQRGLSAGAASDSDEDLPAVYVVYHDWEQYPIRNLTGVPNVVEKPPPDEMVLNEPPSPPPSQYAQHNPQNCPYHRHPGPRRRPADQLA
ncbi:hypothetical protein FRC04_009311, partial [Tulasnella sp. 424]